MKSRKKKAKATKVAYFKIYPSIGIARLGNGPAQKDQVVFSPEVPWANLFETDNNYYTEEGALKKQAQRFYIYECDSKGKPIGKIDVSEYDIEWTAEVANKKPFWYDFNNSLDLSVQVKNQNLSPNFFDEDIAPAINAERRNPNVLDQSLREKKGENYRKELVNNPGPVSVSAKSARKKIVGRFPSVDKKGKTSEVARTMGAEVRKVPLGTLEYDEGTLIFYGSDGVSASLNPSDLNTDFADNSNWYDDICDGRITAKLTHKETGTVFKLTDAQSAAWIATTPPDYAPQIQPIASMYDLVCGAANPRYTPELSLIFPLFYKLYRMQWVNLGDFMAPSFRETIDRLTEEGNFKYIYSGATSAKGKKIRREIFNLFRNPHYDANNEPIIPSKDMTSLATDGVGTDELKLPYYPGDGINYPGSPAQWFAIPPMLYEQLKNWRDGRFKTPAEFKFRNIDEMGAFYREIFQSAAKDDKRSGLLMTRAVLETLYGGGFHPGVELTWPLRHNEIYAQNDQTFKHLTTHGRYRYGFYGLREVRLNAATPKEQAKIFYNDFGFQITAEDVAESLEPDNEKAWFWKMTPGDLTKWMGIPWQSDAGSCQTVFTKSQYPVPAWWAANLPVDVLTKESYEKLQDPKVLESTKQYIYGNRLPWLHTVDTGFVGYHAEAGYLNGLINMVYKWKDIGVVTGRKLEMDGEEKIVYVSYTGTK